MLFFFLLMNDWSILYYTAIPPPIDVEATETNDSVYTVDSETQTYTVEVGNEFSVICVSSGTFNGRVTWIKLDSEGRLRQI